MFKHPLRLLRLNVVLYWQFVIKLRHFLDSMFSFNKWFAQLYWNAYNDTQLTSVRLNFSPTKLTNNVEDHPTLSQAFTLSALVRPRSVMMTNIAGGVRQAQCVLISLRGLVEVLKGKGRSENPTMDQYVADNSNSVSWKQNVLPAPFISFRRPHIGLQRCTFITVQQGG